MVNYLDENYQNSVREFAGEHVSYCVSHLVSELFSNMPETWDYYQDLLDLSVSYDYEEAASDQGWCIIQVSGVDVMVKSEGDRIAYIYDSSYDDITDIDDLLSDENAEEFEELVAGSFDFEPYDIDHVDEIWESVCSEDGISPYEMEVFEHWIVSGWLADRLEAKGEAICRDLAGLTVWGRCTTGQAIYIDRVICDIYNELHGLTE